MLHDLLAVAVLAVMCYSVQTCGISRPYGYEQIVVSAPRPRGEGKKNTQTCLTIFCCLRFVYRGMDRNISSINCSGIMYSSSCLNCGLFPHVSFVPFGIRCAVALCLLSIMFPQSFLHKVWESIETHYSIVGSVFYTAFHIYSNQYPYTELHT